MVKIEVVLGDITTERTDVIVNAANESLGGGGGVDGAIHKVAGSGLTGECTRLYGCPEGRVRITGAYNLPCNYVIHTTGPKWGFSGSPSDCNLSLRNCYWRSLIVAKNQGLKSISFSCISTGVYGFPEDQAAKIAVETVKKYVQKNRDQSIETVRFVCFRQSDFDLYTALGIAEGKTFAKEMVDFFDDPSSDELKSECDELFGMDKDKIDEVVAILDADDEKTPGDLGLFNNDEDPVDENLLGTIFSSDEPTGCVDGESCIEINLDEGVEQAPVIEINLDADAEVEYGIEDLGIGLSQKDLKKLLDKANKAYRNDGQSELSDEQYDYLLTLVVDEDFKNKIGVEIEKNKIDLPVPMGSMTKIKTQEEVEAWYKAKNIISSLGEELMTITPKLDGMSLLVKYELGAYQKAYTRGDGAVGQDVTEHFRYTKVGKNVIEGYFSGYLIGEAIMKDKVFEKKYKGKYKNPRNMVAGVLSRKEITAELSDIDFIAYNVVFTDDNFRKLEKRSGELGFLNVNNNKMFGYLMPVRIKSTKDIDQRFLNRVFDELDTYQFDGLVVEVNDKFIQGTIGNDTNSLNPAYARAWKPASKDDATSKVTGVTWQISKTGSAKPVVHIEPVDLCGVTISNVTGINAKFMKESKIGVGAVITIIRSGDVIPKIVDVVIPCEENCLPIHCPSCNTDLAFNSTKVDLVCSNILCRDRVISSNADFLKILGVEEVGEGVVKQLYEGGVETIADILSMKEEDFEELDSFASRKAEITYREIHSKMSDVSLSKIQHASNLFKSLGSTKLALLDRFDSRSNIPTRTEIVLTDGFSDKSADAYLKVIEDFWDLYDSISEYVTIKPYVAPIVGAFTDRSFVFTGGKPKEMITKIKDCGGKIGSSVSKKTFMLVVKAKGSGSDKETKATANDVQILDWEELEAFLKEY
jgi:NAD-dependent DNA ligase/O-acetyl-ADP-ribose deacetylase (regulator of RNase III)